MMDIRTRIRDWWRGYSDADEESLRAKLKQPHKPGEIIWLTSGEMRALYPVRRWWF